jgi:hypothetical protein
MTTGRPRAIRREPHAARTALCMAALLFATCLCGCADPLPYTRLAFPYAHTQLKSSASLDVLNLARAPEYQFEPGMADELLLTQSDTAVAFSGRTSDRRKFWFTLVVFDQYRLTATRKYFFLVDERAEAAPAAEAQVFVPPRKGLAFDSEFAIDPEILTTPYATEEAQKIAMIRWLAERFQKDMTALIGSSDSPARGSAVLTTAGMMMRQTFMGLLVELDKSPGLAQTLADTCGMEFPHISMDTGRARLTTQNDLAALTLRVRFPLPLLPTEAPGFEGVGWTGRLTPPGGR